MGATVSSEFALGEALGLRANGHVFLGDVNHFLDVGAGLEARWRFIRSAGGRHGLSSGIAAILTRESMSIPGSHGDTKSLWNPGLAVILSAHATIWRSLRVVGQAELWALARDWTVAYGDEPRETMTFSHWRPVFGLGLEYAL
jgi:hypothetical protein